MEIKNINGYVTIDKEKIGSEWKEYFEKPLCTGLQNMLNRRIEDQEEHYLSTEKEITTGEVPSAIKKLNNGKAAGI